MILRLTDLYEPHFYCLLLSPINMREFMSCHIYYLQLSFCNYGSPSQFYFKKVRFQLQLWPILSKTDTLTSTCKFFIMLHKIDKNKKVAPKLIFFNKNSFRKIRRIFDVENGLWKSDFGTFRRLFFKKSMPFLWSV